MQSPLGFGKKYFTFSSILAHTTHVKLQSQTTSTSTLLYKNSSIEHDEIEEEDPPIEIDEILLSNKTKPCHCNAIYNLKTRLSLLLNQFIPRCPYYTTYFAFRRSGVHPPLLSL